MDFKPWTLVKFRRSGIGLAEPTYRAEATAQMAGAAMWVRGGRFESVAKRAAPGFGVNRSFDGQTYAGDWNNGCFQQGDSGFK
jgi:hypothetical protein